MLLHKKQIVTLIGGIKWPILSKLGANTSVKNICYRNTFKTFLHLLITHFCLSGNGNPTVSQAYIMRRQDTWKEGVSW